VSDLENPPAQNRSSHQGGKKIHVRNGGGRPQTPSDEKGGEAADVAVVNERAYDEEKRGL